MNREVCGNCLFFLDIGVGIFRRYPPVHIDSRDRHAKFPYVDEKMWCGEWQPNDVTLRADWWTGNKKEP